MRNIDSPTPPETAVDRPSLLPPPSIVNVPNHHAKETPTQAHMAPTPAPADDAAPAVIDRDKAYEMHWLWLYFTHPEMEAAFAHYHFVESGCYGGKAYCFLAGLVSIVLIWVAFQKDSYPTADTVAPWYNIPIITTASMDFLLFGTLFIPAFVRWREQIILLTVFLHWPTFVISSLESTDAYNYVYTVACYFFCLICWPRFWTATIVLAISPFAGFLGVTFGDTSHFSTHSHSEIILWPIVFFALATLRVFEERARNAFAYGHRARERLQRIDRQIELTQEMVVRYFPATPTAALVLSKGRELHREYPLTAMVMTDIKGFTAFANRAKPEAVIDTVRRMFEHYDDAAQKWDVEKVSTVGDAYFAAVFASLHDTQPLQTAANRAARAVAFAFAAVSSASVELPVRVGVHIGNVVGGFIGAAPPKFDLFGPDVDQCKYLEQTGEAGLAHVSHECAATARRALSEVSAVGSTPLGELWMAQKVSIEFHFDRSIPMDIDLGSNASNASGSSDRQPNGTTVVSRAAACKALLALATDDRGRNSQTPRTSHSPGEASLKPHSHGSGSDDDDDPNNLRKFTSKIRLKDDDGTSSSLDKFALSYLLLEFRHPATEAKYRVHYADQSPTAHLMLLSTGLFCYFIMGCIFMMCVDSMRNKLVLLAVSIAVTITGVHTHVSIVLNKHPRPIIMSIASQCVAWILFLGADVSCSVEDRARNITAYNLRNLAGLLWDMAIVMDTLVLERTFKVRTAVITAEALSIVVLIPIRQQIYGDGDGVALWTWLPLAAFLSHSMLSYALEVTERHAFASAQQLRQTMRSAKGREAEQAELALDVMLPRFATEKLLRGNQRRNPHHAAADELSPEATEATEAQDGGGDFDDRRTDVSSSLLSSSDDSGSASHRNMARLKLWWSIEFAAVIFIDLGAAPLSHLDTAVHQIETVVKQHVNAVKIKSTGTAVLCAIGIDNSGAMASSYDSSRDDELLTSAVGVRGHIALTAAHVAVDCARTVLHSSSSEWRVGVHAGPLIGAMFGSQGVIFDVFGDTVNSASRVTSTGEARSVTVSQSVARLLDAARIAGVRDVPDEAGRRSVTMKGLGTVETVQLRFVPTL